MDWLEKLSAERRATNNTYAAIEALVEAEGGGYEIECVSVVGAIPLLNPIPVAAGDEKGVYHLD